MKRFSNISDNLKTSKDSFIDNYVNESGLPREMIVKLYENYEMYGEEPTSKLNSMLSVGINLFTDSMNNLLDLISTSTKETINDLVLKLLSIKGEEDSVSFFKILMFILLAKDEANFSKVAKEADIDGKLFDYFLNKDISLFESVGIPVQDSDVNSTKIPVILGLNDGCEVKEDIEFYGNLKTILAKNNKRWGANRHLDNVYNKIWDYLNAEIEYLTNKDLVTTSDNHYYDVILNDLLIGELNPMYREINTLRELISDIQTFNFDLMLLITHWVKSHNEICQYISRREYDGFINATTQLYSKISSSEKVSKVAPKSKLVGSNGSKNGLAIWNSLSVDYDYDFHTRPIKTQAIVDMLYIIKSCSVDYNIGLRPYLRNFVTQGFNLVGKIERLIIEHGKINKYKN